MPKGAPGSRVLALASIVGVLILCGTVGVSADRTVGPSGTGGVTTNNWTLTPAGIQVPVGDRPLGAALSPDGRYLAVSNDGEGVQSLALVDTRARLIAQKIEYHAPQALFVGVAWTPDGRRLFASAGGNNLIRSYEMRNGQLTEGPSITLAAASARSYPAGLTITPDGRTLVVAENLGDRVTAIDVANAKITGTGATGPFPYAVVVSAEDGKVYVSNWGDRTVSVLRLQGLNTLATVTVGLHPGTLALDAPRHRLFVANTDEDSVSVIDTRGDHVLATFSLAPYPGAPAGSIPNGLSVSPDGQTLFIANGGNNAIAVADIQGLVPRALGLIPTAWYPTTVTVSRDAHTLFVTSAKGLGAGPNPGGPSPLKDASETQYVASMIVGTVSFIPIPDGQGLAGMTARVAQNNGFYEARTSLVPGRAEVPARAIPRHVGDPSFIKHVIYVIKENRTYDQVLGDIAQGNGDPKLLLFGPDVSPNHHRLARDFVLLDNFYANAEVSADGHNWSMAAMANDYVQKTWPANYSNRGRSYDFEGGNPAAYPRNGFLWDAAARAKVSYRVYGEFTEFNKFPSRGTMPSLEGHVAPQFPGYNLRMTDQARVDAFLDEFHVFERRDSLPQLVIVRLPNDHTAGTRPGYPTPQAMVADNDLAFGRIVEAVSLSSQYSKNTLIVAVEDDAQNGPDHVDAHRTIALLAGAYVRRGAVDHTLYSTVSLLRTIELILGIRPMTQYDSAAQPMLNAFTDQFTPLAYKAAVPRQPLTALNTPASPGAAESLRLPLEEADEAPPAVLNRILWRAIKGNTPMPVSRSEFR